ncbi:hypothetical protein D3C84_983120 [compost metagenome]
MIVTGRVVIELGAVADHRPFEVLLEQSQPLDQGMNGPQRRPRDIVRVHLVAAHHQQRRTFFCLRLGLQQAIDTEQTIRRREVRLAAGTVQQLIDL